MYVLCAIIIIFAIIMAIKFYGFLVVLSFKALSFAIDILLVGACAFMYFDKYAVPAMELLSPASYIISGIIAFIAITLYMMLLNLLDNFLPRISSILNYALVCYGLTIAIPFVLQLISPVISIFNNNFNPDSFTNMVFSANKIWNTVLKYGLIALLALPLWHTRMEAFINKH